MKRVLILGNCGSGKSTLAVELAARTGLPVVHLDKLFWRPGWQKPTDDEFLSALDAALAGDQWIIEGNYSLTLERRLARADTAIWLDLPRSTCLLGVLARVWRWHGRTRPDLPDDCPDHFSLSFLHWVWTYPRRSRDFVVPTLERFESEGGRVIRLGTRDEAREWLASGEATARAADASM